MSDTLVPLSLPPGIFRNGTDYQSRGRWHDAHLVRFYSGAIEPVGGWRVAQSDAGADIAALIGVPRGAISWRGLNDKTYIAIGTTQRLYVIVQGTLYDITPTGFVAGHADTTSSSGQYGAGAYGAGAYGVGPISNTLDEADTWQLDSFGDYLVAVSTSDNTPYVWAGDPSVRATVIDISASTGGSHTAAALVATPEKFLFALGTSNQRRVTWANQGEYATWGPLVTNSAGSWDLQSDGRIMAGQRTKNETLIWTDVDAHAARYVGGLAVYRFDQIGDKCGLISRRAKAIVDSTAFWMGGNNFFMYDGNVRAIPSDVRDYVFSDFNFTQAAKVWAMSVSEFGEVWWYYPSAASLECDRYVVYNYLEGHWTTGQLPRTAGVDAGASQYPIMCDAQGKVYEHEILHTRAAVAINQPGAELLAEDGSQLFLQTEQTPPYLESGPVEIGGGDTLMSLQRLVPDERTLGDVRAFIFSALYPTSPETEHGPFELANPTSVRINARQVRLRLEQVRARDWRVGVLRFGVRPSARR